MRLLFVVLLAGCGASAPPQSFSELARPSYGVQQNGVDSGKTVALDGHGAVWTSSWGIPIGNSGFVYQRAATQAERTRVESAFAALPDAGCAATPTFHTQLLENDQSWQACADGGTLLPPWDEAAASVQALAP